MSSKVTLDIESNCEIIIRTIDNEYTKKCSFCGKKVEEVKRLIAAKTVSICDECIELAHDILVDENLTTEKESADSQA
jgi:hypothetical protein